MSYISYSTYLLDGVADPRSQPHVRHVIQPPPMVQESAGDRIILIGSVAQSVNTTTKVQLESVALLTQASTPSVLPVMCLKSQEALEDDKLLALRRQLALIWR